jgi:hypothetical protein
MYYASRPLPNTYALIGVNVASGLMLRDRGISVSDVETGKRLTVPITVKYTYK